MTHSNEEDSSTKPSGGGLLLVRWRNVLRRFPFVAIVIALVVGAVVGVPVTDATDAYFSSNAFCATGCHVMEATVYKEYQESAHWNTKTGVRPSCADCHISKGLTMALWDHAVATRDAFAWLFLDIRTPEAFEKVRTAEADRVRFVMLRNDSKNCRKCHVMEGIEPERKRGQRQHAEAKEQGTTCIVCHYNLVHKEVEPSDAFLAATESR